MAATAAVSASPVAREIPNCYSMASNYNAFGRPAVVSVRGGEVTPMVRRETVEDLLAREY